MHIAIDIPEDQYSQVEGRLRERGVPFQRIGLHAVAMFRPGIEHRGQEHVPGQAAQGIQVDVQGRPAAHGAGS